MSAPVGGGWSRLAVWLGVLSTLGAITAWYYGLSLGVAALALLCGLVGRLRGERRRGALIWPLAGLVLGTVVYAGYLVTTDVPADAGAVIDESFGAGFDDDFQALVGEGGDDFGTPSSQPTGAPASQPASAPASQPADPTTTSAP